jgi:CDP-glucose 4,6-dehydratase
MKALSALKGKRVLVTGHTGFKGSWLCLWLHRLGAEVYGLSLEPPTKPSMFEACRVESVVDHRIGDICDAPLVFERLNQVKPDLVLHLAAQPIVRQSLAKPLETLATNILGTANVLEAVRLSGNACSVVVVSSDKCYENHEWIWGYREEDRFGGKDPYSMSKGATELVVASWRSTYFSDNDKVKLASARAGNVLGGGDWAADRIVPDCVRAFQKGNTVELRNPLSTRPWQHVLEPLCGYLLLASRLLGEDGRDFCSGWNFGPAPQDVRTVKNVVELLARNWPTGGEWVSTSGTHPKEAIALSLNCDKAIGLLHWRPVWPIEQALKETASWYNCFYQKVDTIQAETDRQISEFEVAAAALNLGASPE